MSIDEIKLNSLELGDLVELQARISDRIDELKKENKRKLLIMMNEEAKKLGVNMNDLLSNSKGSDDRKPAKVKYRDEEGNTWTGRGRAPAWLLERLGVDKLDKNDEELVRRLDEFLVSED